MDKGYEHKIQQLVINRNKRITVTKKYLYTATVVFVIASGTVLFWLNASADTNNIAVGRQSDTDAITQSTAISKSNELALTTNPASSSPSIAPQIVLDASGHVVARRVATVSSRVTGKVNALYIEEGVHVKKSAILAELDDKQAQISYQISLAELAAQQASYQELLIKQKYAKQKLARRQLLAQDQLISAQHNEDSQLNVDQINAQLSNQLAQVNLAKQRSALALYQLEQHKIRAPFDGVVVDKNAQVGELISAGGSGGGTIRTGVGTLVDMNSLEVEVEVGESYINRVTEGQKTIATLDAYPHWKINSEVIAVIPTADRQKASIKVRVKLHQVDSRVLPDMGVKVSFLANQIVASL